MHTLKKGTTLQNGKYIIKSLLGQGSFGLTYLAGMKLTIRGSKGKTTTSIDVAIKEFFMKDFNTRLSDGSLNDTTEGSIVEKYKKNFKKEADNLAKMNHPGIVDILDTFEEKNTCYLVMAYIDGMSLDSYIAKMGSIPEKEALSYVEKISDALHYMHCQRMLHLDLKPKNIMINNENNTFLIDFGLSKQYDDNHEPESSTTLGVGTPGYAPIEQSMPHSGLEFPMTIDIYALGATFYKLVTGLTPPYAASLLSDPDVIKKNLVIKNISKNTTSKIIKAMNPRKEDRFKSVEEFMKSFGWSVDDYKNIVIEPEETVVNSEFCKKTSLLIELNNEDDQLNTQRRNKTRRIWYKTIIIVFIVCFSIVLFRWFQSLKKEIEIEDHPMISNHIDENLFNNTDSLVEELRKIPNDFVLVPGGQFKYKGHYYEEGKIHDVKIDSFYICKFELTQAEYERTMGELLEFNYTWLKEYTYVDVGPKYNLVKGDSIPVRGKYEDFIKYCNKRSEDEGYEGFYEISDDRISIKSNGNGYRLITPYEWIFASYGGTVNKQDKYLGGKKLSQVAWHLGNSGNVPHPVGQKLPNILGLYDLQGNASEMLQGDDEFKYYISMMGSYRVSDWNYPQCYDPRYIRGRGGSTGEDDEQLVYGLGTRIILIPPYIKNRNLNNKYEY